MPNALSLKVGDFFAESSTKKTWLMGKKSLTDIVRECLADSPQNSDQKVLIQYHGTAFRDHENIAFFVTSGFENLLELAQAKSSFRFSRNLKSLPTPHSFDSTFGINERVDAKGKVLTAVAVQDLEFIFSKLELLSIRTIAIGFLHSKLNSANEKFVAKFFEEKGFQVCCSHLEETELFESRRWLKALARARTAFRKTQIANELKEFHPEVGDANFKPKAGEAVLELGLESFLAIDSRRAHRLALSATSIIASGFYNTPEFSEEISSFDPGPMITGKSFAPTLIDFLFATSLLSDVEAFGLTQASADRAKPRILEAILALVRNNQDRKHIDIQKELANLEKILSYRIWSEVLKFSEFKTLRLRGALAPAMTKLLKAWRPRNVEVISE